MRSIAILGGTFDPVHQGHLQTSLTIQSELHFDSYYFLPCKIPIIKAPSLATEQQRIDMLHLALDGFSDFRIDLSEINRDSPSYMVDTLQCFRKEHKGDSITLILGFDAFLSLPKWYKWEKISKLANLLIINRAEFNTQFIPQTLQIFLKQHQNEDKTAIQANKAGVIYLFDAGNYNISSTAIREKIKNNSNLEAMLPEAVYKYIKDKSLYQ